MHEIDRNTFSAKTTSTPYIIWSSTERGQNLTSLTNAMYIGLNVGPLIGTFDTFIHQRKIVVYHHINLKNVNSASDDIGSNQNLE